VNTAGALRLTHPPWQKSEEEWEWEARNKAARIGADYLKRMGYVFDRDAAIGVYLTAAAWERWNGPIESVSSEVDWYDEHAGTPFGTTTKDRKTKRLAEQKARGQAFNASLHEYVQREHPRLAKLPTKPEPGTVSPTQDDLAQHQERKLQAKLKRGFTGKRNTNRDSAGRFAKADAE
jgi:hypothetical protein